MQRSKLWLMIWISLILIAWGRDYGYSQVDVKIPDIKTTQDTTLLVPILISDLSSYGIISYQFQVVFDSLVIKAVGVSVENTSTEPWGSPAYNIDSAGIMVVGVYGTSALSAGDTLLNLIFKVIGSPGDSTLLKLTYFEFNNNNPQVNIDNGSLKIVLPSRLSRRVANTIPERMQLLSNYPEPFQDRTTILANLDNYDQVDLKIYNILGQQIKHFKAIGVNGNQLLVEWDVTDDYGMKVPPGIYFCVVKQSNKIVAVDRMILVK